MEPILFYGVPQGCSFGSIVALEWLNQPYRLCRIVMPRDMQGDLYARVNRVRETPAMLLESGMTLSESAAILQHIASRGMKQGFGFAPGTPESDRLNQALSFLTTTFFASFSPLWKAYEMEANPPVQDVLRETGREAVAQAHEHLEALLSDREWIAGDRRTVADAYFIGISRWAEYHDVIDQRRYARVDALIQKLSEDPAVEFARAIEDERPAQTSGGFRGHVTLEELRPRLVA